MDFGSWWWTGRPGVLRFMWLQIQTRLSDWTDPKRSQPLGFLGGSDGSVCLQCGRPSFSPWVGKIPPEKDMATRFSILAWRIPWTEEPGRLQSLGLQRVRHDWATSQAKSGMIRDYFCNFLTHITLCTTFVNNSVLFIFPFNCIFHSRQNEI